MNAFTEMVDKMREIYTLYNASAALQTAVAPGGHQDTEAIRLPVYSYFLKEFLGRDAPVPAEGPVDIPTPEELMCYRTGAPLDERLTRIDEELFEPRPPTIVPMTSEEHRRRADRLASTLRSEVFRYFPSQAAPLQPEWAPPVTAQGRTVQKVAFASVEGVRVKATYSRPAATTASDRLPAVLLVDHRKGIPVWGNEQPLDRIDWGQRAVLVVETLDRGSRALEQNLRSYVDDDLLHHMRRGLRADAVARAAAIAAERRRRGHHDRRQGRRRRQRHVRRAPGWRPHAPARPAVADAVAPPGAALSRRAALHRRRGDCGFVRRQAADLRRSAGADAMGEELWIAHRMPW
jgi:hypothetical protein